MPQSSNHRSPQLSGCIGPYPRLCVVSSSSWCRQPIMQQLRGVKTDVRSAGEGGNRGGVEAGERGKLGQLGGHGCDSREHGLCCLWWWCCEVGWHWQRRVVVGRDGYGRGGGDGSKRSRQARTCGQVVKRMHTRLAGSWMRATVVQDLHSEFPGASLVRNPPRRLARLSW